MIKQHIEEIKQVLKEALPKYEVLDYPENPESFQSLHPIGSILIRYDGSSYSSNETKNKLSQNMTSKYELSIITKSLNSSTGSYVALETIKQAIFGYQPSIGTPFKISQDGFGIKEGECWFYFLNIETEIIITN